MSRHVVFNENHFPFQDGFLNTRKPPEILTESASFFYPLVTAGNHEQEISQEGTAKNTCTNPNHQVAEQQENSNQNADSNPNTLQTPTQVHVEDSQEEHNSDDDT